MVIWIILLAMTAAAVMAVLWPLSRHYAVTRQADPDTQFYREQIAEIERDQARGVLMPSEAEAAKAEAGRRLLRATGIGGEAYGAVGEPALRRRRAASTLTLSIVPILALATYEFYGSPQLLSRPATAAMPQQAGGPGLMDAVAQIEAHLAKNPQDGRGWEVIAPVYVRMGRMADAAKAYEAATRHLPPNADRFANYGEVLVMAGGGLVSGEAQAAFEQAVKLDAASPKARFYLARAAAQDGQTEKAKAAYEDLLAMSPPEAPWIEVVRQELAALDTTQAPDAGAPVGPDAIAGMVAGLASRLETQGGTAEEWARLMRSYAVLGQRDKAFAAARRAREALAQDGAALKTIDTMAQELKLTDAQP